jgi:hypothetical protein
LAEARAAIYIALAQFDLLFNCLGAGSAAVFVLLCRFFHFLPGFLRKVELINHRENIIPLPFPVAPVKVIRHKPIDGILTTRKPNSGTLRRFIAAFTQPFPSAAPAHHHASNQVEVIQRPHPAMSINWKPLNLTKRGWILISSTIPSPIALLQNALQTIPTQRNRPGQTIPDTQPFNPPLNTTAQNNKSRPNACFFRFRPAAIPRHSALNLSNDKNFHSQHLSAHAAIPQLAPGPHQGHPAPRHRR